MNPGISDRLIKFLEFIDSSKVINGNNLEDKFKNLCLRSGELKEDRLSFREKDLDTHGSKATQSSFLSFTSSDQSIPGLDLVVPNEPSTANLNITIGTNYRFEQTKKGYRIHRKFIRNHKYNRRFFAQQKLHQKRVIEADKYREQLVMQAYGLTQEAFDAL